MKGSEAERIGLCEGDQILQVNSISFENLSHSEVSFFKSLNMHYVVFFLNTKAVRVLKSNNDVEIVVKYFPYGYKRSFDRTSLIAHIQDKERERLYH